MPLAIPVPFRVTKQSGIKPDFPLRCGLFNQTSYGYCPLPTPVWAGLSCLLTCGDKEGLKQRQKQRCNKGDGHLCPLIHQHANHMHLRHVVFICLGFCPRCKWTTNYYTTIHKHSVSQMLGLPHTWHENSVGCRNTSM
jgi:hypothetical protein